MMDFVLLRTGCTSVFFAIQNPLVSISFITFITSELKICVKGFIVGQTMKVTDLKKMRNRAPFRPFQLHLTNGETLPVRHPELLSMPAEPGTELFVVWVGVDWNLVDAGEVARVSLLDSKAGRSKS